MPNLINYTEEDIDVFYNPLQYSGKVAASMKLVQSHALVKVISSTGKLIASDPSQTIGTSIVSYRGTQTMNPYVDSNGDISFSGSSGIIYDLKLSNGMHFPMAEGTGDRLYDTSTQGSFYFSISSPMIFIRDNIYQDEYHYNINNGFNDLGDGIKRPYPINGQYTNPACNGHNGAETKVTMPAFRPELEESAFHYNQNDYSSTVLSYDDLIANNYYIFLDNNNGCKDNLITLLPIDLSNLASGQKTFRRQFKTFR